MASHHAVDNPKKEAVLVVVIPAFNEERFIGSVVLGARQYAQTVIVVDDGSTDATAALAEAGGALVLRHEANLGKGAALNTGFQKARALGAEMVVILDGDGQHRADEIPNIVQPIQAGSADMVLGSRYMGEENAAPFYRKVGQVVMTWLTNASSGVHMTDTLSGYRAFSRRALERIDFHEGGWGAETELQFQAHDLHLKIAELPIHVVYQERAKRNPVAYSLHIINAVMRLVGQHRPLLFFGLGGLILLLAGLLLGVWVVIEYQEVQILAIGTALISIMLTIIGSVTFFTGIMLHSMRGFILEIQDTLAKRKIAARIRPAKREV